MAVARDARGRFSRTIAERIGRELRMLVEHAAKLLIVEIDRELRANTPVDTGHARASWVPSVGSPFTGTVDGASRADHDAGLAEVRDYVLALGKLYEVNTAPYIRMLNEGWSQQAPALFVEAAIDRAMATVHSKLRVNFQSRHRSSVGSRFAENLAEAFSPFD